MDEYHSGDVVQVKETNRLAFSLWILEMIRNDRLVCVGATYTPSGVREVKIMEFDKEDVVIVGHKASRKFIARKKEEQPNMRTITLQAMELARNTTFAVDGVLNVVSAKEQYFDDNGWALIVALTDGTEQKWLYSHVLTWRNEELLAAMMDVAAFTFTVMDINLEKYLLVERKKA